MLAPSIFCHKEQVRRKQRPIGSLDARAVSLWQLITLFRKKNVLRELRDFSQWIKEDLVPTESKLRAMEESGFSFPVVSQTLLDKPEQLFETFPREPDHGLDILYVEGDDEELIHIS